MEDSDTERTPLLQKRRVSFNTLNLDQPSYNRDSVINESEPLHEEPAVNEEKKPHIIIDDHVLSTNYSSLDYDNCENELYLEEEKEKNFLGRLNINISRWIVCLLIGLLTALIAAFIDVTIVKLSSLKFGIVKELFDKCVENRCLSTSLITWLAFNILFISIAAFMTAFLAPVAAGSGIPQIKCFLNGIKIPYVVRFKTLIVKVVGVIFTVCGGLAIGKEGPMIHSGSIVAAGISQGRSSSFGCDLKFFQFFRTDTEKRDFVSAGAAAGVSAAFGAPVGGVLFSLEEGASFWNQELTWRIFFTSMVSTFTLNVVQSYVHGKPWQLSYSGLLNFGEFKDLSYTGLELLVYLLMGIIGGCTGIIFVQINKKLTLFRQKCRAYQFRGFSVMEAVLVATSSTIAAFVLLFFATDCQPLSSTDTNANIIQMYCGDGEYNSMAGLWFQTPEQSVNSLFHDKPNTYHPVTVGIFAVVYFFLSCWTYGLSVPSGLFIPCILTGAAWGRLIGILITTHISNGDWADPGKFALIGAAAQLGGIVRMTISLTVIMIEATGNISFGLPLMITIMTAKFVGDLINEGIYDTHIELAGVPILGWEPPHKGTNIMAKEVMSHPVVTLRENENVGRIVDILQNETHDGFPVVENSFEPSEYRHGETAGRLVGLITRSQLIVLLKHKVFDHNDITRELVLPTPVLKLKHFRDIYPRFPQIQAVNVSIDERSCNINLKPFMNPAPYGVLDTMSLSRIFKLFRGLGLRHLVVISHTNEVIGIVSRKDLARYKDIGPVKAFIQRTISRN